MQELSWLGVLRISADAKQEPKLPDGRWVWDLVEQAGQRRYQSTQLLKRFGWIPVELSIFWKTGYKEPWILVSGRPAGPALVQEYRRRWSADTTYADCKTRGWRLNASHVTDPDGVERRRLVLALAVWWTNAICPMLTRRSGMKLSGSKTLPVRLMARTSHPVPNVPGYVSRFRRPSACSPSRRWEDRSAGSRH